MFPCEIMLCLLLLIIILSSQSVPIDPTWKVTLFDEEETFPVDVSGDMREISDDTMAFKIEVTGRPFQRNMTHGHKEMLRPHENVFSTLDMKFLRNDLFRGTINLVSSCDELCATKMDFLLSYSQTLFQTPCSQILCRRIMQALTLPSQRRKYTETEQHVTEQLFRDMEMTMLKRENSLALLMPITSKGINLDPFEMHSMPLFQNFLPTLLKTTRNTGNLSLVLYLAYDDGDPVFDNPQLSLEVYEALALLIPDFMTIRAVKQGYKNKIFHHINALAEVAYREGCQYFLLANDDMSFLSEDWAQRAISILRNNPVLPNFGTLAFFDVCQRSPFYPTYPFFSRLHLDIFGRMHAFTPIFSNQLGDPWLSDIYVSFNSSFVPSDLRVKNEPKESRHDGRSQMTWDRYVDVVEADRLFIARALWGTLKSFEWSPAKIAYGPEGILYRHYCSWVLCQLGNMFFNATLMKQYVMTLSRPLPFEESCEYNEDLKENMRLTNNSLSFNQPFRYPPSSLSSIIERLDDNSNRTSMQQHFYDLVRQNATGPNFLNVFDYPADFIAKDLCSSTSATSDIDSLPCHEFVLELILHIRTILAKVRDVEEGVANIMWEPTPTL